jgi:hypothetical protein
MTILAASFLRPHEKGVDMFRVMAADVSGGHLHLLLLRPEVDHHQSGVLD